MILALLLQATPLPTESGNQYIRQCDRTENAVACIAYALGVYQSSQLLKVPICKADGVDMGQLVEIGKKYIRAHPEQAHYVPALHLLLAWQEAFPCKPATK